jgi:hypothetical protein
MSEDFLGTDIALFDGDFLVTPDGDVGLVSGRDCLVQDIMSAIISSDKLTEFLKDEITEINSMDLAQTIEEIIEADPRVIPGSTKAQVEEWTKESLRVSANFQPIDEGNPINLVVGHDLGEITVEVL